MSLEVAHIGEATLVTVRDPGECAVLGRLAAHLHDGDDSTFVIDVSALTLAPREGVELLVKRVQSAALTDSRSRWAFVASRLTARRVLTRMCAGSRVGVYGNVADALGTGTPSNAADRTSPSAAPDHDLADELRSLVASGGCATFAIAPDAIPIAVRCCACGRLHLPERVPVLASAQIERPAGAERSQTVVALQCPRCDTYGILEVSDAPAAAEGAVVDKLLQRSLAAARR